MGLFFTIVIGIYLAIDFIKIILAKQLKSKLTKQRIFYIKKTMGVILAICGIMIITKGFVPVDMQKRIDTMERNLSRR